MTLMRLEARRSRLSHCGVPAGREARPGRRPSPARRALAGLGARVARQRGGFPRAIHCPWGPGPILRAGTGTVHDPTVGDKLFVGTGKTD